jgi:hypothetical protein
LIYIHGSHGDTVVILSGQVLVVDQGLRQQEEERDTYHGSSRSWRQSRTFLTGVITGWPTILAVNVDGVLEEGSNVFLIGIDGLF